MKEHSARCHHNPNSSLSTFHIRKVKSCYLKPYIHGTRVTTHKQQWRRISLSRRVQRRIPHQLSTPFFPKGCNCPYFNFLLHAHHRILSHMRFLSRLPNPVNYVYEIFKYLDSHGTEFRAPSAAHKLLHGYY